MRSEKAKTESSSVFAFFVCGGGRGFILIAGVSFFLSAFALFLLAETRDGFFFSAVAFDQVEQLRDFQRAVNAIRDANKFEHASGFTYLLEGADDFPDAHAVNDRHIRQ